MNGNNLVSRTFNFVRTFCHERGTNSNQQYSHEFFKNRGTTITDSAYTTGL